LHLPEHANNDLRLSFAAPDGIFSRAVFAAETKMSKRPTKIIPASCDLKERETSPQGQFVCRYVCNNADKSKIALVYSSSGLSQCRSAIERTIKVVIK